MAVGLTLSPIAGLTCGMRPRLIAKLSSERGGTVARPVVLEGSTLELGYVLSTQCNKRLPRRTSCTAYWYILLTKRTLITELQGVSLFAQHVAASVNVQEASRLQLPKLGGRCQMTFRLPSQV